MANGFKFSKTTKGTNSVWEAMKTGWGQTTNSLKFQALVFGLIWQSIRSHLNILKREAIQYDQSVLYENPEPTWLIEQLSWRILKRRDHVSVPFCIPIATPALCPAYKRNLLNLLHWGGGTSCGEIGSNSHPLLFSRFLPYYVSKAESIWSSKVQIS